MDYIRVARTNETTNCVYDIRVYYGYEDRFDSRDCYQLLKLILYNAGVYSMKKVADK